MKKYVVSALVVLGLCLPSVFASMDSAARAAVKDIQIGRDNANQIRLLRVAGDAIIGGDLTLAGDQVISGSSDVDSITVDAAAGIDTQAAGPLLVGGDAATKVEIADTGVETEVQGDLEVIGTSTLGTLAGVLKATVGVVSAATAGTDYSTPSQIFDTVAITSVTNGALTNAVSVQCYDAAGVALAREGVFQAWFTTATVQTTPTTNNVESFSSSQGSVAAYLVDVGGANPVYLLESNASGLYTMNVVGTASSTTNMLWVLSPNGTLESESIVFED